MSQSDTAAKVELRWDDIIIGEQILPREDDKLSLDRWKRIDIRLDPRFIHHTLTIYESTLLLLKFEKVDAAGRRLTR